MEFDFKELRLRILAKFDTCGAFAAHFGKSPVWISSRLNNVVPWASDEIHAACEALEIQPDEIAKYFFTPLFR